MNQTTIEQKLHYILRLAVAMCFIGHGAFGIITKPIWANYFAIFGIGHDIAYNLMPIVGAIDILLGLVMLVYPLRAIALWLVIWGIVTASLRPLSGEPFAETIERAGNFGAPLALLILHGGIGSFKDLFKPMSPDVIVSPKTLNRLIICLRIVVCLLLVGHGWLNVIQKKGLISQYTSLGFNSPMQTAQLVGAFEIVSGFLILIRPFRSFIFLLLIWKMASELFYPHYEVLEWVERGGSYCTILALWLVAAKIEIKNIVSLFKVAV